jgi:thioredoxin reductase/NAD-dependent dihydropyrimidine dehydrogenase PreA subunit
VSEPTRPGRADDDPAPRARVAPRAESTSDVRRPRSLLVAAAVAAAVTAAGVAAMALRSELGASRPLARPHVQAKVACTSCHADEKDPNRDPKRACGNCHGTAHASTRPAHRKLAARGELGCVSCHPAHAGYQGVTFTATEVIRWGPGGETRAPLDGPAPAGATVPLVAAAVCARCHDLAQPRDPVARCFPPGAPVGPTTPALCFDEHQKVDEPAPSAAGARCGKQHGEHRFAAWDAARRASAALLPVEPRRPGPWPLFGIGVAGALVGLGGFALARRRKTAAERRVRRPSAPLAPSTKVRLPQVNASTCIGCHACVDACPFDVFEIQRYVAVVARPSDCCGVVLCEQVCPNGSITIREGGAVEDRARVDEHLESADAPGVFLAGDLTGLPLIKNAVNQGVRVVDRIAQTLPAAERGRKGRLDVVIVGAGPAGLSAALRAKEKGLTYAVIEQGTVASSIQSFPRNKLVFDQPLNLPVEGDLWLREATKEELLAQWTRIVRSRKLDVREHRRVVDVAREDGAFVVTAKGEAGDERLTAARIVLAIGRRGSPRKLALEIAAGAEGKVSYALADARSFAGRRVLVVGLGDAAMEAAVALARQPGTEVTVAYRGTGFVRGKARNVSEMKRLAERGAIRLRFETHMRAVSPGRAVLVTRGAVDEIPNDHTFILIGGVPSWELVEKAGVRRTNAKSVEASPGKNLSGGGS